MAQRTYFKLPELRRAAHCALNSSNSGTSSDDLLHSASPPQGPGELGPPECTLTGLRSTRGAEFLAFKRQHRYELDVCLHQACAAIPLSLQAVHELGEGTLGMALSLSLAVALAVEKSTVSLVRWRKRASTRSRSSAVISWSGGPYGYGSD
ncbi:hypothetical protein EJ03DRAFT_67663 [Teratosphaeria nubilosa]|uniref:Uncharacterized protein n=1 Tax=Teratosphaeria nubilosa TaxID=161662 RepID=A0A6G1LC14_9PEZI|nr:hypothetical protein EJ03DRAFT_67663 [Teratosphaeria nubilosa]